MGNKAKSWFLGKMLEWALKETASKDVIKNNVLPALAKTGVDPDLSKQLLKGLFEDWISELE
jgi:hypothetical protein